jgi:MinD-like ATPase involved in chromosome partitioning or flagellar assembly
VDLPTYTNIWRIEKRLYKLYDFRLPAPLPITWIAVFAGITVPYIFFLVVIGLPFNHNLVWLYVLPPGVLTWLTTRPVIENKRLPELVSSQLRYLSEPKVWCRMAPFAEKDDVLVTVRVWHRHPPGARPKKANKAARRSSAAERAPEAAALPGAAAASAVTAGAVASGAVRVLPAETSSAAPVPVPQRAAARPEAKRARARPEAKRTRTPRARQRGPEPDERPSASSTERPSASSDEPRRDVVQRRPRWAVPSPERRQESRTLEVSHDPEPDPRDLGQPGLASFAPPSWPEAGAGAFPQVGAFPEVGPFPEAGAFPEVGPFPEAGAFPEAHAFPDAPPFPEAGAFPEPSPLPETGSVPEAAPVPEPASVTVVAAVPEVAPVPEPAPITAVTEAAAVPEPAPVAEAARVPENDPVAEVTSAPVAEAAAEPRPEPEPEPEPIVALALEPLPAPEDPVPAKPSLWSRARPAPDPVQDPHVSAPEALAPQAPAQDAPAQDVPAQDVPASPASARPGRSVAAKVAALFVDLDGDRPVPSVERALSGPESVDDASWRRRVKVVTGGPGQGPGQRDRQAFDRDRAKQPLPGPRRIAVLGCTSGAGQSVVALMTGHTLAAAREVPVAVLDLNPGDTSLAARIQPATSVPALLADGGPGLEPAETQPRARPGRGRSRVRLDVVAGGGARVLGPDDYRRLAGLLAERYPLTMIDAAPAGLTRVLELADQLMLVTPASPDAAGALAHTQQWLSAHGYDELAARSVTVINGVSRQSMPDVLQAESVARGRCRAIVRLPWDDLLAPGVNRAAESPAVLHPQTRVAYTALTGVLVAGLAPKNLRVTERGTLGGGPRTPKESW